MPLSLQVSASGARTLTIGVDVRGLEVESSLRRGIGRYVVNLLRAMARNFDHRLVLFGDMPPWEVPHLSALQTYRHLTYATYSPSFADDLDVLLLTDPAPVLVGRKLIPFPLGGLPCATIFYDLIPLAFREHYLDKDPALSMEYLARLDELRLTVTEFLTISEFVAADLRERLRIESHRVVPILGGLDEVFRDPPTPGETARILDRLGIYGRYFFYTGGTDYRKNLATLLIAFQSLRAQGHEDLALVLAGEISEQWLTALARESSVTVAANVRPLGYVSDEDLRGLYAGAAGFVFPSLYEGFGLPALEAMACGCPVIASDGSSLREIVGDAGLLVNPGSMAEIAAAMKRLAEEEMLADDLRARGRRRSRLFSWDDVAQRTEAALRSIARPHHRPSTPSRRMKVVIQNRNNAFIAPGGDTMVMEELYRALRSLDVEADVAAGSCDLDGVDLVHLVNLTVRQVARETAQNARSRQVPYVVTTLFEDWPLYLERSIAAQLLFKEYIDGGRDEERFRRGLERMRNLEPGIAVGCTEVAEGAAGLFACGESEAERLRDAYPRAAGRIHIAPFGIRPYPDISERNKAIAREKLGFDNFIVCCGRLETRKNQLMLLKAMQDSDLPIVFLAGGFTYQESYADLVMRFPRRGPVKVLGRQGKPFLWAALGAAAAHVLPSWYELPGLVSLEAAAAGTAVVASDWGSIHDYLPRELIHVCDPGDPDSIRRAVEDAIRTGPNPEAERRARTYTWEAFGRATLSAYERILSRHNRPCRSLSRIQSAETYSSGETIMLSTIGRKYAFDASIIVPVFNNAHLTRECLEALATMTDSCTHELILVDNHSTDDTPQLLQAVEGDVTVLRQPVNRGFAAACNIGARVASGEYLVFLNNDTRPLSGWLDELVNAARSDPSIGAVGAKLLYPEGDVQHAGVAFNDRRCPYHIFQHFAADDPAVNEPRDMKAVTGACMLVPAELFREMGGFDEGYRNGFEDIEFCLQLGQRGLRIVYHPRSVVIHREETSPGRKDFDRENFERFLSRWGQIIQPDESKYLSRYGYTITWRQGMGTYEAVRREAKTAADSKPVEDAPPTLEQARALYAAGQLEAAAAMLRRVVEDRVTLARDDAFDAWQTLGNCLTGLNRAEEAERAYHAASKLDPDSERPFLGLGTVAMLQGNWQAAMFGFMTALAKNPQTTKGEFGVGLSMAARHMHEDAIAHFNRVLERDPDNAEALFYLYRSAMESGQPLLAIEPIERYLARHPQDLSFRFNLCGAYWKSGQLARATDLCRQVLAADPNHAAAREVLDHLKATASVHA